MSSKNLGWVLGIMLFAACAGVAQNTAPAKQDPKQEKTGNEPRRLSDKENKRQQQSLAKELNKPFQKWLDEDVAYIITPEERQAFNRLQNVDEREQFIEQFWRRRDPTPDTEENEYREEHYRRIAYANEHFASGIAGWRTDRGRMYVMYGPPDDLEDHSSGGTYQRPPEEGGGTTSSFPFQIWRYHYIEGVGQDVSIEFVDKTQSGEFRMTADPSEKDAMLHVPGAGLTALEEAGLASKNDRFNRLDGTQMGASLGATPQRNSEFERLQRFAHLNRPPAVKFKDLEEIVNSKISFNLLPFQVRTDFIKMTSETVLAAVTVQLKIKDMSFRSKDGVNTASVNIFGSVTNLTGRVVQRFEDTVLVEVPVDQVAKYLDQSRVYWNAIPLPPGLYRLSLVVKDINSGNVGTSSVGVRVPRYEEDGLSASSLILADDLQKVSSKEIGKGQFVIGSTKVRPAVGDRFTRDQTLGIYMQVYNLATDDKNHKPSAMVEYALLKDNRPLVQLTETSEQIQTAGQQLTLEKLLPLGKLPPGSYKLQVKVTDRIANRTITPSANFTVQ